MKFIKVVLAAATIGFASVANAHGNINWGISIGIGQPYYGYGYGYYGYPGIVYPPIYRPAPVYVNPPVYYVPPRPVIVSPPVHQQGTQFSWVYDDSCSCYIGRYK